VDGATILGSAPELQNNFGKIGMGNEVETYLYLFMPLCFNVFSNSAHAFSMIRLACIFHLAPMCPFFAFSKQFWEALALMTPIEFRPEADGIRMSHTVAKGPRKNRPVL
jgi:hypothetical protein